MLGSHMQGHEHTHFVYLSKSHMLWRFSSAETKHLSNLKKWLLILVKLNESPHVVGMFFGTFCVNYPNHHFVLCKWWNHALEIINFLFQEYFAKYCTYHLRYNPCTLYGSRFHSFICANSTYHIILELQMFNNIMRVSVDIARASLLLFFKVAEQGLNRGRFSVDIARK